VTDVTSSQKPEREQEPVLSAADEQLLQELTERARTGVWGARSLSCL